MIPARPPSGMLPVVHPGCRHPLQIERVTREREGMVAEGRLLDPICGARVVVTNGILRFVESVRDVESFGYQWHRFRKTQLDRFNGTSLSRDRFLSGTGWTLEELRGQRVLDAGCGAGRFTDVLLASGAEVCAFDASVAVDACLENIGWHPRLTLAQAVIEAIPFSHISFDKVLCYGVLQNTADPQEAFRRLVPFIKPGGWIAVDIYRTSWRPSRWNSRLLWRPLTRRMRPETLLRLLQWYVPRWVDVENRMLRSRVLREAVASVVPCWNYTGRLELAPTQVKEWAVLDTFDALAAWHDHPRRLRDVRAWCEATQLQRISVRHGGNGIVAVAQRPAS